MAFTPNNDLNLLQASDTQNVGAGAGDDTYIIAADTMTAGQVINVTDTEGANNIKLVGGVTIASSVVASTSIQLTLSNGAVVNVFGADTFNYILGGSAFDTTGTSQNFNTFATQSLGVASVPTGNATSTGAEQQTVSSDGTIAVIPSKIFLLTAGDDTGADFTGGEGNDFFLDIAGTGLTSGDVLNGGAGKDALSIKGTQANAGANGATLTNIELLVVTNAVSGTIDLDNFTGFDYVRLDGGLSGSVTVNNVASGTTLEVDTIDDANQNIDIALKANGTSDSVNVTFDDVTDGDVMGSLSINDAETISLNVSKEAEASSQDLTMASLNANSAKTLSLTGDAALTITGSSTSALTTINAGSFSADLDLKGVGLASSGSTVILGSGNDMVTSGSGADVMTGGAGTDVFTFTSFSQSTGTNRDTITDFVSGTDKIDFVDLTGSAKLESDGVLWIDSDGSGALSEGDFQVLLQGVSSISNDDII